MPLVDGDDVAKDFASIKFDSPPIHKISPCWDEVDKMTNLYASGPLAIARVILNKECIYAHC